MANGEFQQAGNILGAVSAGLGGGGGAAQQFLQNQQREIDRQGDRARARSPNRQSEAERSSSAKPTARAVIAAPISPMAVFITLVSRATTQGGRPWTALANR